MVHMPRHERLRRLLAQLEQLPPSKQRDDLLRQVRHRAVASEAAAWESSLHRTRVQPEAVTLQLAGPQHVDPCDDDLLP